MLARRRDVERPAQAAEANGEEEERRQLGGEGLGGSDADLRTGMRVEDVVRLAGNGGADHVADGESAGSPRLGFAEAAQRVGGLAALRDGDAEGPRVDERLAIAELARQIDLDRDAGQGLDHELAGQRGVPARAAGDDVDLVQARDRLGVEVAPVEIHVSFLDGCAPADGVGERAGLLVDLLVHEVLVAVLLRHGRRPVDPPDLAVELLARPIGELDPFLGDDREVSLLEEDDVAGVGEDGGDVAGDEISALAEAQDEGRGVLRDHQHLGRPLAHHGEGVGPLHLGERSADRVGKLLAALLLVGDEVGEDLGVRLRAELVAGLLEVGLQLEVVLDDPVVDDGDAFVLVGMRILVRRLPVGRPAGVPDARRALRRRVAKPVFQILELSLGADDGQALLAENGEAGGVVSAVLELAQSVDEEARALLVTHVSNDAAHSGTLSPRLQVLSNLQPVFFDDFFGAFFSTQPSMLRCLPALTAREPAGTSSRTVVPVPT